MDAGEWNRHDGAPKQKHDPEAGGHAVDPYNPMSLFRQYMRYRPATTSAVSHPKPRSKGQIRRQGQRYIY